MNKVDKISIGFILLAAGSSSRMGQSKQLLIIDDQPLLRRTVQVALDANPANLTVVLGSNFEEHQKVISDLPVHIVNNENWQKGMGHSLKIGVTELLEKNSNIQAIVILVCDQPLLTSHHINKLIQTFRQSSTPIIATGYSNTIGVPALFDKSYFETLLKLPDHHGAKSIIQKFSGVMESVSFPNGAFDLDTPDDLLNFRKLE
jgi:molybdenum cofactor cytidylyltransferase